MARVIYEARLTPALFPCRTQEEAQEMLTEGMGVKTNLQESVSIDVAVNEEHTVKLFLFCRTLQKLEKFEWNEIFAALIGLAQELGYDRNAKDIADQVQTWCERLEYMDDEEFNEWLID